MFKIDEYTEEQGWVTVRTDVPESEREGLALANADMMFNGEGEPQIGAVRFVDLP